MPGLAAGGGEQAPGPDPSRLRGALQPAPTASRARTGVAGSCHRDYDPRRGSAGSGPPSRPARRSPTRVPTSCMNAFTHPTGRLKARLSPMRGLKQDRSARVIIAGHALVQNVRRGHYELAVEEPATRRLAVAFDELAVAI